MENVTLVPEDDAGAATLEETGGGGASGRPDGRASKLARFVKVQLYLPLKDVVLVDEQKLKLMKQGVDISRSRLVSEAIRFFAKEGGEAKIEVRG